MPVSPEKKARRQREALLVSQYIAENFPNSRVFFQQRVGPINPTIPNNATTREERMVLGNFRRAADAIIILPVEIVVLEGYIHPNLGKISQLLTYIELVPFTPELQDFVALPVRGLIVGAQSDPVLTGMAARFSISVEIFQPSWVKDYLIGLGGRFARERNSLLPKIIGSK